MLAEIASILEPEFQVVCSVRGGDALLQAVLDLKPDIVVTDIRMPGRNGIEVGREVVQRGLCIAVVVLSLYKDAQFIRGALDGGIRGYVLKDDAGEELIPALHSVLSGGQYLSRGAASALLKG